MKKLFKFIDIDISYSDMHQYNRALSKQIRIRLEYLKKARLLFENRQQSILLK
jgi:hypothetical protein